MGIEHAINRLLTFDSIQAFKFIRDHFYLVAAPLTLCSDGSTDEDVSKQGLNFGWSNIHSG